MTQLIALSLINFCFIVQFPALPNFRPSYSPSLTGDSFFCLPSPTLPASYLFLLISKHVLKFLLLPLSCGSNKKYLLPSRPQRPLFWHIIVVLIKKIVRINDLFHDDLSLDFLKFWQWSHITQNLEFLAMDGYLKRTYWKLQKLQQSDILWNYQSTFLRNCIHA